MYYNLMQFDEQKDDVAVEQILRVIFLDPERPSPVRWINKSCFLVSLHSLCTFLCFHNSDTFK